MSEIETAFYGFLGRDAETKISANGRRYVRLNIRVGSGDAAQWLQALVFDDDVLDEIAALTKGDRVYIEGALTATAWIDQRGGKPEARPSLTVMASHAMPMHQIGRRAARRRRREPAVNEEAVQQ
jgi:single-stranded DNA-binding protein